MRTGRSASTRWKPAAFFQAVGHRQPQTAIVGALSENFRDVRAVEGAQGVEYVPGLGRFVRCRAQLVDDVPREKRGVFVEADNPRCIRQQPLDAAGTALRFPGDYRYRGMRSVMTVLHAGSPGTLPGGQQTGDGLVHGYLPQHLPQGLQRQPAGTQQPGRRHRQVDDGGFHPHGAGAAVYDAVDPAVHVLDHVGERWWGWDGRRCCRWGRQWGHRRLR